jgi:hypothetical protein
VTRRPARVANRLRRLGQVAAASLAAFAAVAAGAPGTAAAAPCPADPAESLLPCDLEVSGGEEAWHAGNVFSLGWRNPPQDGGPPVAAVHYRVLDASMQVVLGEKRIDWAAEWIEHVSVPFVPGVYTAEVWLEDAAGNLGPPVPARLRFDDARPGHVDPLPASGWIGRPDFPYAIRFDHPTDPRPLSGIRGYAVAVDRDAGGDPCAAADRCTETETDLRGGAEEDALSLAGLPEGTSYVHAAAVSGSGMKSASVGHAVLRVDTTDPVTTLSGAPGGWANRPVTLVASATDAASGMAPVSGDASPFTAIRVDGGAPVAAAGDMARTTVIAPGVHTVAYYARDAAGNADDGSSANGQANPPPATATVRVDPEPPRVAFASAQDPRDPETIEARVLDSLSGPDRSRGEIAVRRAGSDDRFEALPTGVEGGGLRARWDSGAYPPGLYEFRATGFDLAGNASTTRRRASGAAMVLPNPLKRQSALKAGLGERATRLVPFGRGALYAGRLIAGRRTPLAAAPVRVVERFDAGAGERVSTVRTDSGGFFALRLAPGPSREIVAAFAGTATASRAVAAPVRLSVRGGVRMQASSAVAPVGGRPVVFRGKVMGAIPPGGKYVQLQFRLPGVPWTEFRTIQTDPRGRFRYAYGFNDDDSRGVRFQFRAFAPAQGGWPYEPAGSRPLAVRGR